MSVVFYIDNINAYEAYGVFVQQYGYKDLVSMPKFKKIEINDWLDQDGIEADLSSPQLDTKNLSINFYCIDSNSCSDFIALLSNGTYHTFFFPELQKSFRLRLISESNKNINKHIQKFTLRFADDFPFYEYSYQKPLDIGIRESQYKLDGVDFCKYGIYLLKGTNDSILKSADIKSRLVINNSDMPGAVTGQRLEFKSRNSGKVTEETIIDDIYYKSKNVVMKCVINADLATFWQNYNALIWDLSKPNERLFYIDLFSKSYKCYYNSCTVSKFDVLTNGKVWCEFTLTLVFTNFRVGNLNMLLATEDGALITTEDNYLIDMNYVRS